MGDRRNKFCLCLFILSDFDRHVVDGIGQFANLIVIFFLNLHAIAAGRNPLCHGGDLLHRSYNGADKVLAVKKHQEQQNCAESDCNHHAQKNLLVHQA